MKAAAAIAGRMPVRALAAALACAALPAPSANAAQPPAAEAAQDGSLDEDDYPRTRIEEVLDQAYQHSVSAGTFTCSSSRRGRARTTLDALEARYERIRGAVGRRLGRRPYQSIIVSSCRIFNGAEFREAVNRAQARLDRVEAMLRRRETD